VVKTRFALRKNAACPDQVWAIDFVSDATADGRPLKILTVTDEHTREAPHWLKVRGSTTGWSLTASGSPRGSA
jgi:transposase InsO family protein